MTFNPSISASMHCKYRCGFDAKVFALRDGTPYISFGNPDGFPQFTLFLSWEQLERIGVVIEQALFDHNVNINPAGCGVPDDCAGTPVLPAPAEYATYHSGGYHASRSNRS